MNAREGERPLLELAQEVAGHMPGWTAKAGYHEWGAVLAGPDGAGVYMNRERSAKLAFSGNWPENLNGHCYVPNDAPRISVSQDREPKAIAAEIKRRLLPLYLPAFAAQVAKRAQHVSRSNDAEAFAGELGRVLGKKLHERNSSGGWAAWHGGATFEVARHGSIRIELSADQPLALKVAALVAAHEAAKPADVSE